MLVRPALTAAVLSAFALGAGHLYLGRPRRGVLLFTALAALYVTLGLLGLLSRLPGFLTLTAVAAATWFFALVDCAVIGARSGRGAPVWHRRWFVIVAWVAMLLVLTQLSIVYRPAVFGVQLFRVPRGAMSPAIVPGDFVLVDTRAKAPAALAPGMVVVVQHPRLGLSIRRVVSSVDEGTWTLTADVPGLPIDPNLAAVPIERIRGVVIAVLWSPKRRVFARSLEVDR
jgi:TM2 domain-containing membrane protein YozV